MSIKIYPEYNGLVSINPLEETGISHDQISYNDRLYWTSPLIKRVVRFRVLTDRGFPMYDISYCYAERIDGKIIPIQLPFHQLTKAKWKTELYNYAKADGVNAKRLGFFDPLVFSTVY
jgi:hypothetical protein